MEVTKVKVCWLTTAVIAPEFGASLFADKEQMYAAWEQPGLCNLAGLKWTDPWCNEHGQHEEPERTVCRQMLEDIRLTDLRTDAFIRKMFRNAIPLRAAVKSIRPADLQAEVFLFPWAVTAAVTATIDLEQGQSLAQAVAAIDNHAATTTVEAPPLVPVPAGSTDFIHSLARSVTARLQNDQTAPPAMQLGPFVITTPIDGAIEEPSRSPLDDPGFVDAMDHMAGESIGRVFRWIKVANYGQPECVPTDVRRVLPTGMSQWVQPALSSRPTSVIERTTLAAHRNAVLRWARLTALHGELATVWEGRNPAFFRTQLNNHRSLLGRLLNAPGRIPDWIAQQYVLEQNIKHLLSAPEISNPGLCPPDDI